MILIVTTVGSVEAADRIASALVDERLAACVQIVAARSVYRWQGQVERADEWVLHIKTRAALADRIEARVKLLHDYALPELVVYQVAGGSADYLGWVAAESAG